jgi:enoyl-CoA hydratase/carnithine racemase
MAEDLILRGRDGDVVTLTFNDPERLNAMTEGMGRALAGAVRELAADASIRAVVLTGAGRAFSAGGDLDMIEGMARAGSESPDEATRTAHREFMRDFYGLYLAVRDLACPSLAAINGAAIGAGLCVALACDLRIAAREAPLALNFARLGIHPGMGATWTLPRLVGPSQAAELLYTGRRIDGVEAERIGLVNRAVPREALGETARELAAEIAGAAPLAVQAAKRSLASSPGASLSEQLETEATEQARNYESQDLLEGLAAARARRPARFEGR